MFAALSNGKVEMEKAVAEKLIKGELKSKLPPGTKFIIDPSDKRGV